MIAERSALATAAAIRRGETDARAECAAAIARIEARDPPLNAVVVRDFDRAREQAEAADRRLQAGDDAPLLGVPITVKESFDVAGLRTTWGFDRLRDHTADTDAIAVRRLKRAGAVILGKTNVPVGLADIHSTNPIYGRTNNAIDPARVAGGSSGGAAVALASGMVPLELGSDIGGSIRVPAAFNGVWGHKPSYGALDSDGHFCPTTRTAPAPLGVIGPMSRDADDLAAALDILSDLTLPRASGKPIDQLMLLILPAHPLARTQAAIMSAMEALIAAFTRAGARVDRASAMLPDLAAQHRDYMHLLNLAITSRGPPQQDREPPTLADWLRLNDSARASRRAWSRLFSHYDAVIAPVLGHTAFVHDDTPLPERRVRIDGEYTPMGDQFAYAGLCTFPGLPATSVPIARDGDRMPIGAQVITGFHHDHDAIAIARLAHLLTRELRP